MKAIKSILPTALLISPLGAFQTAPSQTLSAGVVASASDAGIFIALERGYFTDMTAALERKAIDAINIIEPMATAIVAKGVGVPLINFDQVVPDMQVAAVFYSEQLITKNPELGRKFMVAYLKGVRDCVGALKAGGQKLEEVIQILMKHTPINDRKVYDCMVWPGLNPNGFVHKDSIMSQQRFFHETGVVKEVVPIEKVVDDSFVNYALQILGRYEGR